MATAEVSTYSDSMSNVQVKETLAPLFGAAGAIITFVLNISCVTEMGQNRAELTLGNQRKLFRNFQQSGVPTHLIDNRQSKLAAKHIANSQRSPKFCEPKHLNILLSKTNKLDLTHSLLMSETKSKWAKMYFHQPFHKKDSENTSCTCKLTCLTESASESKGADAAIPLWIQNTTIHTWSLADRRIRWSWKNNRAGRTTELKNQQRRTMQETKQRNIGVGRQWNAVAEVNEHLSSVDSAHIESYIL